MSTDMLDFPTIEAAPMPAAQARPAAPAAPSAIADSIAVVQGEVAKFDQIEAGLRAIEAAHPKNVIVAAIETPAGMKVAEAGWRAYRNPRLEVEKARKAAKAPVLSLGKAIDTFAGDLETRLRLGEDHYKAQIDAEDARRAAEKAEARRLDDERIAKHHAGIATIRSFLARCQGLPAARIALGIEQLQGQAYSADDWQEFAVPAANAQCETLEAMRALHAQAAEREAEAARLEAQRIENERVAAELAWAKAKADAEQRRIAGCMARITEIRAAAAGHDKASSADLYEARVAVAALDVSEAIYAEFTGLAEATQSATLAVLDVLRNKALEREEAEAARVADMMAKAAAMPALPTERVGEIIRTLAGVAPAANVATAAATEGKAETPEPGTLEAAQGSTEGQDAQQVLKAEGESPDATDRATPADASPVVGPMGAGQAADAAPAADHLPDVGKMVEPVAALLAHLHHGINSDRFPSHPKPHKGWWDDLKALMATIEAKG